MRKTLQAVAASIMLLGLVSQPAFAQRVIGDLTKDLDEYPIPNQLDPGKVMDPAQPTIPQKLAICAAIAKICTSSVNTLGIGIPPEYAHCFPGPDGLRRFFQVRHNLFMAWAELQRKVIDGRIVTASIRNKAPAKTIPNTREPDGSETSDANDTDNYIAISNATDQAASGLDPVTGQWGNSSSSGGATALASLLFHEDMHSRENGSTATNDELLETGRMHNYISRLQMLYDCMLRVECMPQSMEDDVVLRRLWRTADAMVRANEARLEALGFPPY